MYKILPVILAGGISKRLYPITSVRNPKQFNSLIHSPSLFSMTLNLIDDELFQKPVIVGSVVHKELIQKYTQKYESIILEPEPRNTMASILLAALYARNTQGGNAKILVLPSDHLITDKQKFLQSVKNASVYDTTLLGVKPTYPSTQYGYLHTAKYEKNLLTKKFVEKPPQDMAKQFIVDDHFYWNSGIFLFNVDRYINLCKEFAPETYSIIERLLNESLKNDGVITIGDQFKNVPNISADYAILEKLDSIPTVEMLSPWSDIGSFTSLYNEKSRQIIETVTRQWGKYHILECGNDYIMKKLVINPRQSISLQSHEYRSEHWTIITGTAKVVNGNDSMTLNANDSTFIPARTKHKLLNETNAILEVFEIQLGRYLSEKDITRYDEPTYESQRILHAHVSLPPSP